LTHVVLPALCVFDIKDRRSGEFNLKSSFSVATFSPHAINPTGGGYGLLWETLVQAANRVVLRSSLQIRLQIGVGQRRKVPPTTVTEWPSLSIMAESAGSSGVTTASVLGNVRLLVACNVPPANVSE
jgi:hypothetical protein